MRVGHVARLLGLCCAWILLALAFSGIAFAQTTFHVNVGTSGNAISYTDVSSGTSNPAVTNAIFGDTIQFDWQNTDTSNPHSVTSSDSGYTIFTETPFNNPAFPGNAVSPHSFSASATSLGAGSFYYMCDFHGAAMTGVVNVAAHGSATHLSVGTSNGSPVAGSSFTLIVTALDRNGNVDTGFSGALGFSGAPNSPNNTAATFTPGTWSGGVNHVTVHLYDAVSQTITISSAGVTSATQGENVSAASASQYVLSGTPGSSNQGASFSASITAEDPYGNASTSDSGAAITLNTSDADATPANGSSVGTISGSGLFVSPIVFRTTGTQGLSFSGNLGTSNVANIPDGATHFAVSAPSSASSGSNTIFTVTAEDAGNATVSNFADTVHITSSDGAATLPADSTLTSGVGSFSITFNTTGSQTIVATDTSTASPTVTGQTSVNVTPNNCPEPTNFSGSIFSNNTAISIPDDTPFNGITAAPYPSPISVSLPGQTVHNVTVTLYGAEHTFWSDVDILLVGPQGQQIILMSNAAGGETTTFSPVDLTFDDAASTQVPSFVSAPLTEGSYQPTAYALGGRPLFSNSGSPAPPQSGYNLPAPAGSATLNSIFDGTDPNGQWNLYVQDNVAGDSGNVVNGWSISINEHRFVDQDGPVNLSTLGFGKTTTTTPYPSAVNVSNLPGNIAGVTLTLNDLTINNCPADVAFLLQGPGGQFLIPYSAVGPCFSGLSNLTITLDDNAASSLTEYPGSQASGIFKPSSYQNTRFPSFPLAFVSPAPTGPFTSSQMASPDGTATLGSTFTGTNPNGTWNLYALYQPISGAPSDTASFTSWSLRFKLLCAATTSSVTSDFPGGATYPQGVTFTATVSCGTGTPTGPVNFFDGVTLLGTGTLNGSGQASLGPIVLAGGSHSITAVYPGQTVFSPSSSSIFTQVITPATTTTSISSVVPASPSVFNQLVTINALVTSTAGTPIGNVTFMDGATTLATVALSGGTAAFSTSTLAVGAHSFTVSYAGSADFQSGASGATPYTVAKGSTSTALGSSVNPSTYGQSVTFTATISAVAPSSGTPHGSVTFTDSGTTLGTVTLTSGVAQLTIATLNTGVHTIKAAYSGGPDYLASSKTLSQTVNQASTSTAIMSSANPSSFGGSVTFTATLTSGFATPAGSLSFTDNGNPLGVSPLNGGGVATLTTSALTGGTHTIQASYTATTNFGASNNSLSQVVNPIASSTGVITSGSPAVYATSVTFTATVSVSLGTPTGTVTFLDGATPIGSPVALNSSNQAAVSTSTLTVGVHTIHGNYSGDNNFNSSGTTVSQTIIPGPTAQLIVAGFPSPDVAGASHTFTVTAEDQYGNQTPAYAGTIAFASTDARAALPKPLSGPITLSGGTGIFTGILRTAGTQSITATDTTSSSITGSETGIVVNAGAVAAILVSGYPASTTAGASHTFNATAQDGYGNTVTGYTGTLSFTSSDALAVLPANSTLTNGTGAFNAKFKTAGTQNLTATDTVTASLTGSEYEITVAPAAVASFAVAGYASPTTAGATHLFTVTAHDAFGNTATGYVGTVHFTSSDANAVLPADSTLVHGAANFSAMFTTVGTQNVFATDTVTSTLTGKQNGIVVKPGPAATVVLSGYPSSTTAGVAHTFTVTAFDAFSNVATGYAGTLAFSSSDPQGSVPANSTLTNGTGNLNATLKTVGAESLTATDTSNLAMTSTQSGIVVSAAAANSLTLSGYPSPSTAGASNLFSVTAFDSFGNVATGYAGMLHFTSTDSHAALPANGPLASGTGNFNATFQTAGTQTLTATDTVNSALTASQSGIQITAASAMTLVVAGYPSPTVAGAAHNFNVSAKDSFGNLATGYSGTVIFSSSDPQSALPAASTLTSGAGMFAATLATTGAQNITATDSVTSSITGAQSGVVVTPAGANSFIVNGYPASTVAGAAHGFNVQAIDNFGNTATGYAGTVHISSSDSQAVLPANSTLTNGTGAFNATLKTAGTQSVTATDTVSSAITGSDSGISVTPAATTKFTLTAPGSAQVGVAFAFSVSAFDQYGNQTPAYAGMIKFTSTDPLALLPGNSPLAGGSGSFNATMDTAGNASITATDTVAGSIKGTSSLMTVSKGGANATVTSSANPIHFARPPETIQIVVTAISGTAIPTGTVQLKDHGVLFRTLTLDASGEVSFIADDLGFGEHDLTAVYSGDSNYLTATSVTFTIRINPGPNSAP